MPRSGEAVVDQCPPGPRDGEELRLVRAVLAGELGAFDAIMDRHAPPITSLVRRLLANPNDLEDAVQETFIRAFQNLRHFRGEASLRTWLYRIAVSVCEDRRRSGWLRRVTLARDPVELSRPAPGAGPEALSEAAAFRTELERAVRELPGPLRVPFVLHAYQDLSGAEIAATLGWSEKTVWSRIYAARKRLRRKLQPGPDR